MVLLLFDAAIYSRVEIKSERDLGFKEKRGDLGFVSRMGLCKVTGWEKTLKSLKIAVTNIIKPANYNLISRR